MSGLWLEIVNYAKEKWYSIDILDISPGNVDLSKLDENIKYIDFDLSNFNKNTILQLWKYDFIICNAGISLSWNFTDLDFEKEKRLFDVNILGHIKLIKILLLTNKINSWWTIAFTVSASEMLAFPIALSYASSKWAMNAFARSLRSYVYGKKIKVSCIYPGPMDTPHVKYYGKNPTNSTQSQKKIKAIARKSFHGIVKWKRSIYPDITSKVLSRANIFLPFLDKIMYNTYKNNFK